MRIFYRTDTGRVRSSNQDSAACGEFDGGCWGVVCDGMGGTNGGDIASSIAVEMIGEELSAIMNSQLEGEQIRAVISSAVDRANARIYSMARMDDALYGMGTTVVCAVRIDSRIYVAHAGDSRAYLMGEDGINRLTTDHSMVQELVDLGRITPEEALNHPRKNVITRALGVVPEIAVDHGEYEAGENDIVLLCSDGLTNCVSEAEMLAMARKLPLDELCGEYIDTANNNGGYDNITALVIGK
ncbi:MAG: Stp1/IreP family PP2C-type Ser/Thr phosphatase [Ruminococcaceae bacterium]|nr:Stp1/IreP family PP2C-type Ser/Thr phosphatase [Oscillospiraceae bacterium]